MLCDGLKIKNFAVYVMDQEARPRRDQTEMQRADVPAKGEGIIEENKKKPVEHEWIGKMSKVSSI